MFYSEVMASDEKSERQKVKDGELSARQLFMEPKALTLLRNYAAQEGLTSSAVVAIALDYYWEAKGIGTSL
jgi:hypothetical protein